MCKKELCAWYHAEPTYILSHKDTCGRCMPDSLLDCTGTDCGYYEEIRTKQTSLFKELNKMCFNENNENKPTEKVAVEGVGRDAEVITNENGGKQSKTPAALHLLDPCFLQNMNVRTGDKFTDVTETIHHISNYMGIRDINILYRAIQQLEPDPYQAMLRIGKVLQEGAEKYEPNNWRLIPQEQHINHALIHLFAAHLGDTQDNHIEHALCRIMMAIATQPSEGFCYNLYKKKEQ